MQLVPRAPRPDFDRDVLVPLRAAQAKAAADKVIADAKAAADLAAAQAAQAAQAAAAAQQAAVTAASVPAAPQAVGDHGALMAAAGIAPSDYGYVEYIISHESGWRVNAANPSGAYGLPQSLPGSKMASAGADWATNPVTQLVWANGYVGRYGGWAGAYAFWLAHSWY